MDNEPTAVERIESEGTRIRAKWARQHGLTRTRGRVCWHRLFGRSCSAGFCKPPGSDHDSLWSKDGKPSIYMMQPYGLSETEAGDLAQFCADNGLRASVSTYPSFHYPGRVLSIELTRASDPL